MHTLSQITPLGYVYLLKGIPFNQSHRDTRYFDLKGEQTQYFLSHRFKTFDHVGPVRPSQPLRLPVNINECIDCNYIMFVNANYSDKYFYAFITDMKWVSVNATDIYYQIDVVQTWLFDFSFMNSFIEREHSSTDMPGDNLVVENLELGEYVFSDPIGTGFFESYSYLVAATVNKSGGDEPGGIYSGVYSGLTYNVFDSPTDVNNFIDKLTSDSKGEAIVSITMFPTEFVKARGTPLADWANFSVDKNNGYSSGELDGYKPRNKKLLTWPYNFLFCTNLAGGSAEYRYEFFSTDRCEFSVYTDMSPQPVATLAPRFYKGVSGDNLNEKITMDGFPMCAWATDTYKAWLAQNGSSTAITTLGNAFGAANNLLHGNIVGTVGSALSIAQTVAQVKATQALPPQAHGSAGNTGLVALKAKDFYFYPCTIRAEYAKIIDDYFHMFGYAVHRVKTPNLHSRRYWNYVETKRAVVTGNVPQEAADEMENIMNQGITFWHDDNIGLYNRDNPIYTPV